MRINVKKLFVFLLLFLTIVNSVGAVTIDETFIMLAGDFTMQTYGEETYTFISSDGLTYWNMSGSNVTFVTNCASSHDLIERDGHYNIGNYTTIITADIYGTTSWTVNNLYLRFITNAGNIENKSY